MSGWAITHELATPHPVYGLEWAPDGRSFAFAGGHDYGKGFLGLASADAELIAPLWDQENDEPRRRELILSNLAFARAGARELIVVAACRYQWGAHGPLVFEIDSTSGSNQLRVIDSPPLDDFPRHQYEQAIGIAVHRGQLYVHHRSMSLDGALSIHACPRIIGIEADPLALARHDARLALVGDRLWLAKRRELVYSGSGTGPLMHPESTSRLIMHDNPHGIAGWDLRDLAAPPEWIDLPDDWHVNTLVRDHAGERLWLGLRDHGIAVLDLATQRLERVGELARGSGSGDDRGIVRGILALACAPDDTLIAGEHAGAIGFGRAGRWETTMQLPNDLSPRSLALDPSGTRLAIGCKRRYGMDPGAVLLLARS